MDKTVGAKVVAFETNEHYTYAAGDATACYSNKKCKLALRQLVFLMPDFFVICDRVTSVEPDYKKAWLLHTQNEPEVEELRLTPPSERQRWRRWRSRFMRLVRDGGARFRPGVLWERTLATSRASLLVHETKTPTKTRENSVCHAFGTHSARGRGSSRRIGA